jgi:hypothetical protein
VGATTGATAVLALTVRGSADPAQHTHVLLSYGASGRTHALALLRSDGDAGDENDEVRAPLACPSPPCCLSRRATADAIRLLPMSWYCLRASWRAGRTHEPCGWRAGLQRGVLVRECELPGLDSASATLAVCDAGTGFVQVTPRVVRAVVEGVEVARWEPPRGKLHELTGGASRPSHTPCCPHSLSLSLALSLSHYHLTRSLLSLPADHAPPEFTAAATVAGRVVVAAGRALTALTVTEDCITVVSTTTLVEQVATLGLFQLTTSPNHEHGDGASAASAAATEVASPLTHRGLAGSVSPSPNLSPGLAGGAGGGYVAHQRGACGGVGDGGCARPDELGHGRGAAHGRHTALAAAAAARGERIGGPSASSRHKPESLATAAGSDLDPTLHAVDWC